MRCIFPYCSGALFGPLSKHSKVPWNQHLPQRAQLYHGSLTHPRAHARHDHRLFSSIRQIHQPFCFPNLGQIAPSPRSTRLNRCQTAIPREHAHPSQSTANCQPASLAQRSCQAGPLRALVAPVLRLSPRQAASSRPQEWRKDQRPEILLPA